MVEAGAQIVERLRRENADLARRLEEAEDALRALHHGEVDAVLVEAEVDRVYTLETADKPYRLLVERMAEGAATLTCDGEILYANGRFITLLGRPLSAVLHQPLQGFLAPHSRPLFETMLRERQSGEVTGDITFQRPDGTRVAAYIGTSLLQEGPLGLCLLVSDRTEQRHYAELERAQKALRDANERLDLAQRAGRIGTFEWDLRTGALTWSAMQEELYGLAEGEFGGRFEDWKRTVHPEDRERAEAEKLRAISERTGLDTEFRIVLPGGETRWIAAKGRGYYGASGEPLRFVGVNLDVTDRKRTEEALRDADRRKDEFLATLAHELRNPLAPISNAVQILLSRGPEIPELMWARSVLERQVQLMARLLEDLLDVSRITCNKLELRLERVELARALELAVETSGPVIQAGGQELVVELPSEPIYVDADPVRLAQVFSNLLNNAAKYSDERGRIRLRARREGREVVVTVQDSGIGIDPEMLPRVFQIFSQAQPALIRSKGGLGVGLSLVKGLVELHGGSIEARSGGRGHGSEFLVRLPVAAEPQAAATAPAQAPAETPPVAPLSILIADDNHDSADSLAMLLRLKGHEVITAYDGEQTLEAAGALRPDVALLDLGMPKINGYEACRRIREQPWGRSMLLVAVTGWSQEEDRRRTREVGFDQHLVKPVDPAQLLEALAAATQSGGQRP